MANKIYRAVETAFTWKDSGGTNAITLASLGSGAGRSGAQYDRGAGSLPSRVRWEAQFKTGSAVTIGLGVRLYLYTGETASADLTTDAARAAETLFNNFLPIGQILASSNAVGPFFASGIVELGRYVGVGFWNASGQTFTGSNGDSMITFTPIPDEIQ
jgi:hypothetical protein